MANLQQQKWVPLHSPSLPIKRSEFLFNSFTSWSLKLKNTLCLSCISDLNSGEPVGLDSKYFERRDDSIPLRGLLPSMHLNRGKRQNVFTQLFLIAILLRFNKCYISYKCLLPAEVPKPLNMAGAKPTPAAASAYFPGWRTARLYGPLFITTVCVWKPLLRC